MRILRRLFRDRPPRLIALTGLDGDEDRRRILAAGFDDHLVKPVDVEQLVERIRAVPAPGRGLGVDLSHSVAGEEDPGASEDL